MSNKQNDILVDLAIDKAEAIMELNPTIPEEMRSQLEAEIFNNLKNQEPDDYEPQTYEEMEKADAYWESLRKGEE